VRAFVRRGQRLTARIEAFPKPIIAAVNGLAFGGGCEVVEATHLAVASEDALFAKSEIAIGMMPTFGGTQRLPRLVGRKRALELLLTGEPFPASRALELGLVQQVVPRADLLTRAHGLAHRILRHPPDAVARILSAVTRGLNATIGEGLAIEAEQFARHMHSPALKERLDAWIRRRDRHYAPAEAEANRRASSSISGR
jgi:enoyl-CoA hydratase/carnithine racemase